MSDPALGLQARAFGFRQSRALLAGEELGVYRALAERAQSACELAGRLALDPRGLRILLDALTAIGALVRDGERYALGEEAAALLAPESSEFLGNLWLHDLWHWSSWARLDAAVRRGAPPERRLGAVGGDPHLGDPAVLQRFLPNYTLAMEQSLAPALAPLVALLAPRRPARICDLAGGSGTLALALLDALPGASGLLLEHGFALTRARELAGKHRAGARLELRELDVERDALPAGHDLILISRVLMGLDARRAQALVERAAAALAPAGALLVHDFAAESSIGALLSLDMLLNTGGEVHGDASIRSWLASGGLALAAHGPLLPYTRYWLALAPRPGGRSSA